MSASNRDRKLVLWLASGFFLLIVLLSVLAPVTHDDDFSPTTYNSGTHGAKAAYLLLGELGYQVSRGEADAAVTLDGADAPRTTYLLLQPNSPGEEAAKREYTALERFLRRGGRVLATSYNGAYFLPGGRTGQVTQMLDGLCNTVAEGRSAYAAVGPVQSYDYSPWNSAEPAVRTDQRCGSDAVVVHRNFENGGEMVWWASAEPLTTRGLGQDSSLRLLLASVGPVAGRHVIFDEFYHENRSAPSDYLRGLPLRSLGWQAGLVGGLLLLSYSRRSGPLRDPLRTVRTSPLEFARSMGALYERAGATAPVTEAARRRFLHFLLSRCGLPVDVVGGPATGIAVALESRFGPQPASLLVTLEQAEAARYDRLRPREALLVVRNLSRERERIGIAMQGLSSEAAATGFGHGVLEEKH